jgi:hypothetical protein
MNLNTFRIDGKIPLNLIKLKKTHETPPEM